MTIDPDLSRALGDMREGKMEAALTALRRIVLRRPEDLDAVQMLALALIQTGQHREALPLLARAVLAQPLAPQYRNNYANALLHQKRFSEAVDQWEQAVRLDPGYAMGWLGLACARIQLPDFPGAIEAAKRGLKLRPGWREMKRTLVIAMEGSGHVQEALAICRQALDADPQDSNLRSLYLLLLNYRPLSPETIAEEHREYGRRQLPVASPARTAPQPERSLRVGLMSCDLRTHSVAFFAESLLRHVPASVELTVFSLIATPEDAMTRKLRSLVCRWEEIGPFDDVALADKIRSCRIDILVELNGHTAGNRLSALASRPAPVIVTAIGYPNTTGARAVDWRLVDSVTDPPGSESMCTERLMRLDPCFLCYSPPTDAPEAALPPATDPITFGSFNAQSKISEPTIEMWSKVLAAVPKSRLLLKSVTLADAVAQTSMMNRLTSGGIPASQIGILPHAPTIREHLQLYSRIHIALDTVPYNGTTTTCEALWMGVPVVTLLGDRHAARVGASLLSAIGQTELVAPSPEEYVATAVRLAGSRDLLQEFRIALRTRMVQSPLTNQPGYADRFYAALRDCWKDWCAAQKKQ